MDCPQHPIRKRPKACATCAAPYVDTTRATPTKNAYPHVTEDGLTWLDPNSNPPTLDAKGRLAEPFVLELKYGGRESWGVGLKLPDTPAAFSAWAAELEAKRARIIKPKEKKVA